jgi:hypothetical protein
MHQSATLISSMVAWRRDTGQRLPCVVRKGRPSGHTRYDRGVYGLLPTWNAQLRVKVGVAAYPSLPTATTSILQIWSCKLQRHRLQSQMSMAASFPHRYSTHRHFIRTQVHPLLFFLSPGGGPCPAILSATQFPPRCRQSRLA